MVAISIVMTAFNRNSQVEATLRSFQHHGYDDSVEVIIVDDGSVPPLTLNPDTYEFSVKIIRNEPENKWYMNPCIPYNQGFSCVNGSKVIIQNAECAHRHNLVDYLSKTNIHGKYISFGCYSLNKNESKKVELNLEEEITFRSCSPESDGLSGWYNHSVFRPSGYHFCSAIEKESLNKIGGFDPLYANGSCFDDDEFLLRVKENLEIEFCDEFFVYHLWHYTGVGVRSRYYFMRNRFLYQLYTKRKVSKYIALALWKLYCVLFFVKDK